MKGDGNTVSNKGHLLRALLALSFWMILYGRDLLLFIIYYYYLVFCWLLIVVKWLHE